MKRKVNLVGQNTLTVSLPTKWVKSNNIKKGDEVDVGEDDSRLVISKSFIKQKKSIRISIETEGKRYIRSWIGRLYRYGYSEILARIESPELIGDIKNSVNNLIGADIVDFEDNNCRIRIFPVNEEELDFDKYLIKMFHTLRYMFNIVEEDINSDRFDNENTLTELRDNNWKIKDYIAREAFLENISYEEFSILNTLIFVYEKIGTNLLAFYRIYLRKTGKIEHSKKLKVVFRKIEDSLEWFIKNISKKEPISPSSESLFRKEIRDFHIYLYNELHKEKGIDHSFLTMAYFTIEMLDSTASYLQVYKKEFEI